MFNNKKMLELLEYILSRCVSKSALNSERVQLDLWMRTHRRWNRTSSDTWEMCPPSKVAKKLDSLAVDLSESFHGDWRKPCQWLSPTHGEITSAESGLNWTSLFTLTSFDAKWPNQIWHIEPSLKCEVFYKCRPLALIQSESLCWAMLYGCWGMRSNEFPSALLVHFGGLFSSETLSLPRIMKLPLWRFDLSNLRPVRCALSRLFTRCPCASDINCDTNTPERPDRANAVPELDRGPPGRLAGSRAVIGSCR